MIECLYIEIQKRKNYLNGKTVETIYFGGGTPSIVESEKIKYLLEKIQSSIDIFNHFLEVDPNTNWCLIFYVSIYLNSFTVFNKSYSVRLNTILIWEVKKLSDLLS